MMRVIAMKRLSLLPGLLPAKVATAHLRDYQGNNRLTYTAAGVVLERNDYYPYGGLFGEEQSLQPYKYSGKELETTNGLNLYDFHARYHDYTLPIFTTQDPQQEKYYDHSPYIYCAGNPIMLIDPTGMTWKNPKQAELLIEKITQKIGELNTELQNYTKELEQVKKSETTEKGGQKKARELNEKIDELKERINGLNISIEDIKLLEKDTEHEYTLFNSTEETLNVIQGAHGTIMIENQSIGTAIHEIAHIRQMLRQDNGKLLFIDGVLKLKGTKSRCISYEVEAYKLQYSYNKSFPGAINSIKQIDSFRVSRIKNSSGNYIYDY